MTTRTSGIALVLLLGMASGCQAVALPGPSLESAVTAAADFTLRGRVDWGGAYKTQATMADIAKAATVSLIDVSKQPHTTVGSAVTEPDGRYSLFIPGFIPSQDVVYVVEAVKGMLDNAAGADAARVRTFAQFTGGSWTTITGAEPTISSGTTALCIIYSLRLGSSAPTGAADTFLSSLTEPGAIFNPGSTGVSAGEFSTVRTIVLQAVAADADPVGSVKWDLTTGYDLQAATAPVIRQLDPQAAGVGNTVKIVGLRFESSYADNVVEFNGVRAPVLSGTSNELLVQVPTGATTGNVRVTQKSGASDSMAFKVLGNVSGEFKMF